MYIYYMYLNIQYIFASCFIRGGYSVDLYSNMHTYIQIGQSEQHMYMTATKECKCVTTCG